jgi:hypothetical protein
MSRAFVKKPGGAGPEALTERPVSAQTDLFKRRPMVYLRRTGNPALRRGVFVSRRTAPMAKKPGTNPKGEFVFFDVVYEDGSQRSNRRVPAELLGGLEKDEPALGFLIEQDREIAEKSGRAPLKIVSARRVGAKPEKMMKMK